MAEIKRQQKIKEDGSEDHEDEMEDNLLLVKKDLSEGGTDGDESMEDSSDETSEE